MLVRDVLEPMLSRDPEVRAIGRQRLARYVLATVGLSVPIYMAKRGISGQEQPDTADSLKYALSSGGGLYGDVATTRSAVSA